MRKVTLTLAIALLFAGSAALTADAQTSRGANNIAGAAQNFTPIEPAACRGWGPYCRPGFVRVCGRFRCWCRPCWYWTCEGEAAALGGLAFARLGEFDMTRHGRAS